MLRKRLNRKGQTALEYAMLVVVLVLPIAAAIRSSLDDEGRSKSFLRHLVTDSYGGKGQAGVIGRPYP